MLAVNGQDGCVGESNVRFLVVLEVLVLTWSVRLVKGTFGVYVDV